MDTGQELCRTGLAMGTAPPRGLRLRKGLLLPGLAAFLPGDPQTPCSGPACCSAPAGGAGKNKACRSELRSLPSVRDFPLSLLVSAAAQSASERGSL